MTPTLAARHLAQKITATINSQQQRNDQRLYYLLVLTLTSTMSAEEVAQAFVQHFYTSFDSNVDSLAGLFVSIPCVRSQCFSSLCIAACSPFFDASSWPSCGYIFCYQRRGSLIWFRPHIGYQLCLNFI